MADGFDPRGIWWPNGRAFSQGVIQGPGQVVHVTGQVSWDEHDQVVGPDDVEAQMEKAIDNVRLVLAEVGGVLDDIVSMTIVRSRYFPEGSAPASILVRAAGLVVPELLVERCPRAPSPPTAAPGVLEVTTCLVVPLTKLAKGSTSAVGQYPASSRRCRGRAGPRPAS